MNASHSAGTCPKCAGACPNAAEKRTRVLQQAQALLEENSHFHGRSKSLELEFHAGELTVRGKLPSFYLKQVLHRVLQRVDQVEMVKDQVEVVCCAGLSSEKE